MHSNFIILLILVSVFLCACAAPPPVHTTVTYKTVVQKYAVMQTEGILITAKDQDWTLAYGHPIMPPRYHDSTQVFTARDYNVVNIEGVAPLTIAISPDYAKFLEEPSYARNIINVKITVENSKTVFNGKILFISAREDLTESSAKRAWSVVIPKEYINIAKSGQVAVVYQPAKMVDSRIYDVTKPNLEMATWILWFSTLPL